MPMAEKEFILNYAMNRWQLNFKRNVGPTSDSIRACKPKTIHEWGNYYYTNVRSKEHIDTLGEQLYDHIKNDLPSEKRFHPELLDSISKNDCMKYMHDMVILRQYNGYLKEHGQ